MNSADRGRDSSALLRAAFELGPDAALVFDRQRIVVHANARARQLFTDDIVGLPPGRRAERWTFRDEAGRLVSAEASPSARGLRGETIRDAPCELVFRDGRRHHLSIDAYPLRDDGGAVDGVVCVLHERDTAVDRRRPRLFEGQPAWIEPAARRAADSPDARLRVLAETGRALGTSLDYTVTLETLARATVPALADWCVIRVIEPDGRLRRLPTVFHHEAHAEVARAMDAYYAAHTEAGGYAPDAGIGRVLRTGEPALVAQVSPEWLKTVAQDEAHLALLTRVGMESLLHAPLLLRGRTIGVLTLARTGSRGRYGAADLVLAEELCDRAAIAIENARLFEASERRGREGHAMAEVARVLAETLDPTLVWQRIAAGVRTLLDDAPSAALYYLEPAGDVRAVAVSTETGVHFDWTHRLPPEAGMVGVAIRKRAIVSAEDVLEYPGVVYPPDARARLERSAYRSLLAVPLIVQERVLGALAVGAARGRRFTEREIELVSVFADHAAVAADNARLFEEAQSRRVEAERARSSAEAANRSKDEFLAVLSHELRTPLTAILGWVRMLLSGRLPANRATEALVAIDRNTRVQTRLIDDLLDVSRIVAGKVELQWRPVDLAAVVREVVTSSRQDPRAAAMLSEPVIDRDGSVLGDRERLHQVVTNLVANAVKFTPAGGRVEVRLQDAGPDVELIVSDNGEGISAEDLPQIFDRFHQVDRSNTRRHGGLGLGLAIVRHLVEAHGGRIQAESPGRGFGACFTVQLPRAHGVDRLPGTAPAVPAGERLLTGLRAVFVDDDPDARALVSAMLDAAGADVAVAASAMEALRVLDAGTFDVVLTDIGMPGLDGYDFVMQLRERERAAGRAPVCAIALTAYASAEDRRRALAGGFQAHLAKPVDPGDLVRAVHAACAPARRT
jgi:signal transduction histidine kinase/ActR/RegA family two-component response regulator